MKWACLKIPHLCPLRLLPEGRRAQSFLIFAKAKPIEDFEGKGES